MTAIEAIQSGDIEGLAEAARAAVRSAPADLRHRILLFQAEALAACWDKAELQLQTMRSLDLAGAGLADVFLPVLQAERERQTVFQGGCRPEILGGNEPWTESLAAALAFTMEGDAKAAEGARREALEQAPAVPGVCSGTPFDWVADGDSRFGPVLEVLRDGRYFWLPFCRVASLRLPEPRDLRDLVWCPAELCRTGQSPERVFLPVRYPGTEGSGSGSLIFSRATEWREQPCGGFFGVGQRELVFPETERALLDIRELSLGVPSLPSEPVHA